jgi:hypothetical protein
MRVTQPERPVFDDFKGELLTVLARKPLPPGSRVAFALALEDAGEPMGIQGKVVHSIPVVDDLTWYRMTLRIHSQSRKERDRLAAAASVRKS